MELFYFKSNDRNFGDELNAHLLPAIMPEAFSADGPSGVMVGIGTILDDRLPDAEGTRIVFGSGVRGLSRPKSLDDWDVRFVRGPISGRVTGAPFVADPAYAVRMLPGYEHAAAGAGPVGLMPHFGSLRAAPWPRIAERLGMRYIDPTGDVTEVLDAIASCKAIVAEAMHGAILADALRVPWARFAAAAWRREGIHVHGLKWLDWAMALGVDPRVEAFAELPPAGGTLAVRALREPMRARAVRRLVRELANVSTDRFQLSSDSTLDRVLADLQEHAERIRAWATEADAKAS
ncbi:MAG: polysaccharide pyruvyl transferase family protein [Phycisphaerales bacterium]